MDKSNSGLVHLGVTILLSIVIFYILAITLKTETPVTDFLLTTICVHLIYKTYVKGK